MQNPLLLVTEPRTRDNSYSPIYIKIIHKYSQCILITAALRWNFAFLPQNHSEYRSFCM
jgi:hypothetical protein